MRRLLWAAGAALAGSQTCRVLPRGIQHGLLWGLAGEVVDRTDAGRAAEMMHPLFNAVLWSGLSASDNIPTAYS